MVSLEAWKIVSRGKIGGQKATDQVWRRHTSDSSSLYLLITPYLHPSRSLLQISTHLFIHLNKMSKLSFCGPTLCLQGSVPQDNLVLPSRSSQHRHLQTHISVIKAMRTQRRAPLTQSRREELRKTSCKEWHFSWDTRRNKGEPREEKTRGESRENTSLERREDQCFRWTEKTSMQENGNRRVWEMYRGQTEGFDRYISHL